MLGTRIGFLFRPAPSSATHLHLVRDEVLVVAWNSPPTWVEPSWWISAKRSRKKL